MKFGTSYFGNRIVHHVKEDMLKLKEDGFQFIVHCLSEFDMKFHYGNIADIIHLTQDVGLEAHLNPWGIGKVFGGEPFSQFVCQHYKNACQVLDNGEVIPMACPNAPAFAAFMQEIVNYMIGIKPDVVFWDEPHFHQQGFLTSVPGRWGCRCKYCREKFKEEFEYEMPMEETGDVLEFKWKSLGQFLIKLFEPVDRAGIPNILYLASHLQPEEIQREWGQYGEMECVKGLSTGPYWMWQRKPLESVRWYSEKLRELCEPSGKETQIWIQCCRIERGREHEIEKAVDLAVKSGVSNIGVWGFEGCGHESWISCDDPMAAWKTVLETIKKYQRQLES